MIETPDNTRFRELISADKIYVYGGAFDPVTVAHEALIRSLMGYVSDRIADDTVNGNFTARRSVIFMVSDTDEKNYTESIKKRFSLLRHVLKRSGYEWADGYMAILRQDERTYNMLAKLGIDLSKVVLCMGEDEWDSLSVRNQWADGDKLKNTCDFLVFRRADYTARADYGDIKTIELDNGNHATFINARISPVSSTKARRKLMLNPMYDGTEVSPLALSYMVSESMYGQLNHRELMRAERAAIESSNPEKYPTCSVTATTLILYKEEVLLVRRKAGPFLHFWCLPGGFANRGEEIAAVAVREVKEETNLDIEQADCKIVGMYLPDDPRANVSPNHWMYDVAMSVDITERIQYMIASDRFPKITAGDDAADAMWVPLEEARNTRLAFHHNRILDDFVSKNTK